MDGLCVDFEQKQKQIAQMSSRLNDFKDKGGVLLEELSSMFSEGDERMERLSSFYQMVDATLEARMGQESEVLFDNFETKLPSKGKRKKGKNEALSEHKHDGILSLYLNHKWEAELIAERMKLDLPLVRTVIASHNEKEVSGARLP